MSFWCSLTRTKRNDASDEESKLARVLNLLDLVFLGVGATLGLGVYVLAGSVAYEKAGPAVVLSFLIAGIASAFPGFCYAEFSTRVPRAGSAYVYSYVTIGELVAFTIGWNLVLEYVIAGASVARGLSGYIDALFGHQMSHFWHAHLPIDVSFLASSPDPLAFGIVLFITALLAFGVKESMRLNNILTCVNLATIAVVLVAGGIRADPTNWFIPSENIEKSEVNAGDGGFFPFGFAGVMAGAATCFYGYVGFDCIATTAEEARNPKKNVPLAIVISLVIIFLAYFGISTVLTMMVPYYLQDPDAPLVAAFERIGWSAVKWIVSLGAVCALSTSLLGSMFPLPRILYAMGEDGVIFRQMSTVHPWTKTPLTATIISGLLSAVMAAFLNLQQLIDMMSIGTLLAYTIVSICVLVLHYEVVDESSEPTETSVKRVKILIAVFCALALGICGVSQFKYSPVTIAIAALIGAAMVAVTVLISEQPKDNVTKLTFTVPLVPFLPCVGVVMNTYLMFQLDAATWVRFTLWVAIGYAIYFFYGIKNSTEGQLREQEAERADEQMKQ